MEKLTAFANSIDSIVWSMVLVFLCLGVGLYLSIRLKFPQVRYLGEMVRLLFKKDSTDKGISQFQAFATTVGARVGMGNIAGVATALFVGGPGAIFWMWIIAIIGACSAFAEAALAQAYKVQKADGTYVGGPAYYIEKGLRNKPYAIIFAIFAFMGPGLLLPGVQINTLVIVFEEAFSVNRVLVGAICCVLLTFVVWGGISRIAKLAELLAPLMCLIYMALSIIIIVLNIGRLPAVIGLIIRSAFGAEAMFAGILGSAISWGVKRGIYSNEAGMGCGAIVSAATECSHPIEQGLVQAFSIFVDTLLVGTATVFIIMLTGVYNVSDGNGGYIVDNVGNLEAGVKWTQTALTSTYGAWCGKLLAIIIVLFVFTSMTGYCYQAETNVNYLFKDKKWAVNGCRAIFVAASFVGCLVNAEAMWAFGDVGYGLMAWANIIAILLLSPKVVALLKDYERQKKAGDRVRFIPEECGFTDEYDIWKSKIRQEQ